MKKNDLEQEELRYLARLIRAIIDNTEESNPKFKFINGVYDKILYAYVKNAIKNCDDGKE